MATLTADVVHHSAQGRWRLVSARPDPALARLVRRLEGYDEAAPAPVVRREAPIPAYPIILSLSGRFRRHEGAATTRLPVAFAAGLHDRPVLVGSEGAADCLQIDLTPLGARRIFGCDLHELAGGIHDLGDLLGPDAHRLLDRLAATRGWPARLALAEAFLARRLAGTATDPRAAHAWRRLAASRGRLPVATLAAELGLSRQTLGTLFAREIGLAPKTAARILRLDHARRILARRPALPLAEIALRAGYADQAHFTREARALAGLAPGALRAGTLPDGTGTLV